VLSTVLLHLYLHFPHAHGFVFHLFALFYTYTFLTHAFVLSTVLLHLYLHFPHAHGFVFHLFAIFYTYTRTFLTHAFALSTFSLHFTHDMEKTRHEKMVCEKIVHTLCEDFTSEYRFFTAFSPFASRAPKI
jgi:hypothetical protein